MIDRDDERRLKEIFAELFELDPATIDGHTSIKNVERWDSLQHVSLVVSIEQEFDVRFSEQEMAELLDYDRVRSALAGKLAAQGS